MQTIFGSYPFIMSHRRPFWSWHKWINESKVNDMLWHGCELWPAHSLDVREAEVDLTRGPGRGVTRELGLGDQAGLLQRLHHSFCLKRIFFWFNLEIVFESVFSILQILKQLTQWQMQNIQKYKLKTRHCTNLAHMTQTLWKKSPRAPAKILGFETFALT